MKLAEFSVKNSLFVNMISIFVILGGLFALMHMQREAFPNVTFDVVQITAAYRGSTADQVEKFITSPIEKELRGVSGIEEISSVSYDGSCVITVKLDPDIKNQDEIIADIQRAVDRVEDLPEDVDKPIVNDLNMKEHPIIRISLSGPLSEIELQGYAEGLEDQILDIASVAKIERLGFRDKQIWVEVDPVKIRDYYISMEEIILALNRRNVTLPGGKLRTITDEYSIKTSGEFYTAEEVADVIIRANDAGNVLKVKDVAEVKDAFEDEDVISKADGTRAITLIIAKKEKADAINMVTEVKNVIEEFKKNVDPKLQVSYVHDLSYYIKRRLNVLRSNGIFGFILVIISLFIFLAPGAAFFTALGLPIAFFATFAVMNYFGMSINLITMFGLIMVIGLLVDDSIIISENVYRYVEGGTSPKEAAIKGTSEVMLPVLSTVLTTVAAFTPLMFMSGIIGKFMKFIPQVVIISLLASLLEAYVILPSHLGDFLKPIKAESARAREKEWFIWLRSKYKGLLNKALDFRYVVISVTFVIFVLAIVIGIKFIPVILFSGRGIEQFMIRAEAPLGTSLQKTNEMIKPVEKFVGSIPEKELDAYTTEIGSIVEERGYDPNAKRGSRYAQITLFLTPAQHRQRSASEIADSLRPGLKEMQKSTGFEKLQVTVFREGPAVGKPVEVKIRGDEFETLNEIASKIMDFLKGIPGVFDVNSNYDFGKLELKINIDEDRAKEAGLSISSIASSVRNAFDGGIATKVKLPKAEKEIEVLVRFPEAERKNIESFKKLLIPNVSGKLIPLEKIATLEYSKELSDVRHFDGKRAITVTANVDGKQATPFAVGNKIKQNFKNIPNEYMGYILKFGGEQKETYESLMSLLKAFLLAFLLIFIILTTQFRSLIQPFVVMLAIPLGLIGVVAAFIIHREPFTFIGILGIVGLAGVVVNDSIVLMDFINKLRRSGIPRRDSILQAGVLRMRPVILTTITTVLGLTPTVYGIGGFDPFVRPMALAISWGLLFATALTLIVIPCTYAMVDDITMKIFHKASIMKLNNNKKV